MSYREHMHGLATAVAELVQHGAHVAPDDLPAALTAHAALGDLLREVHASVSEIHATPAGWTTLAHVERHPVAVLGVLLRRHPRIAPVPVSDVLRAEPVDPAARRWRAVARHAAVALHDWTSSTPTTRPQGCARWSETADVAALAEALTPLTSDLASSAQLAGRTTLAERLHRDAASGLAVTARKVRDVAESGPLPALGDLRRAASRRVLPVRGADDVAPALGRLAHLIRTSPTLSPAHVQLVARALAVASQDAAGTLTATGRHKPAAHALDRQAHALGLVASAPRRVATLTPGDPTALHQAQLIHHALADLRRRSSPLTEAQAVAVGRTAAQATQTMTRACQAQAAARNWLTPVTHDASAIWGPIGAGREPELLRHLRLAHQRAAAVATALPSPPHRAAAWPPPRAVLADALSRREGRRARPDRPRTPIRLPGR